MIYLTIVTPLALRRFAKDCKGGADVPPSMGTRKENRYDVRVQITGRALKDQMLGDSGILAKLAGGIRDICACERYGNLLDSCGEDLVLELDDVLWLRTSLEG